MSSHPGSTLKDAVELAQFLKRERLHPEQVQDFYPTPGTISTACLYRPGSLYDGRSLRCAHAEGKSASARTASVFKPQNHALVEEALRHAGRPDLIGNGANCLIRPQAGVKKHCGSTKNLQNHQRGKRQNGQTKSGQRRAKKARRP